jgi:ribulose-phosphate 3-epimerase
LTVIDSSPDKIARLRRIVGDAVELEVDGGIDVATAPSAAAAGATLFVAGSALFGAPDPAQAYRDIAAAAGCSQP